MVQVKEDPELVEFILRDPRGAASLGLPVHLLLPALQQEGRGVDRRGEPVRQQPYRPDAGQVHGVGEPDASGDSSSGFFTGMQRRLNTLAARFRRNQASGSASTSPNTATGAAGHRQSSSWLPTFGRSGGAYQGIAGEERSDAFVSASRGDRARVAAQGTADDLTAVEIELPDASGAASVPSSANRVPRGDGKRAADPFVIADDEEEDESESTAMNRRLI
jgi:hypothetical protein